MAAVVIAIAIRGIDFDIVKHIKVGSPPRTHR